MYTQITHGKEAEVKIKNGIEKVSKPVIDSIGPVGANTIIEKGELAPLITNDGVTIARNIRLEDSAERVVADALIQGALRTNFEAGDGTSTTIALTYELIKNFYSQKLDRYEYINELEVLKDSFIEIVNNVAEEVGDNLERIAYVSCQNSDIANMISDVFNQRGKDVIINIKESMSKTVLESRDGLGIDSGFSNTYFCNDTKNTKIIYNRKVHVVTYRGDVNEIDRIAPILQHGLDSKVPIIIVANGFSAPVTGIMYQNFKAQAVNVAPITLKGSLSEQNEVLDDIELLLDSTPLEGVDGNFNIGVCNGFESSFDNSIFLLDKRTDEKEEEVNVLLSQLKSRMKENENSELLQDKLSKRMARIGGGFAELSIGGDTKLEISEKKLRAEDAIRACRAAMESGIVEGGGKIFLLGTEYKYGIGNALRNVHNYINNNVIDKDFKALDPAKVITCAIKNSVSIAKTLLTANSIITNENK